MTQADKLIRFAASCEVDLFTPEPNESPLRTRWRTDFSILERLALYDAAEIDPPVNRAAWAKMIRDVTERERKSRNAMQDESREQAFRGER